MGARMFFGQSLSTVRHAVRTAFLVLPLLAACGDVPAVPKPTIKPDAARVVSKDAGHAPDARPDASSRDAGVRDAQEVQVPDAGMADAGPSFVATCEDIPPGQAGTVRTEIPKGTVTSQRITTTMEMSRADDGKCSLIHFIQATHFVSYTPQGEQWITGLHKDDLGVRYNLALKGDQVQLGIPIEGDNANYYFSVEPDSRGVLNRLTFWKSSIGSLVQADVGKVYPVPLASGSEGHVVLDAIRNARVGRNNFAELVLSSQEREGCGSINSMATALVAKNITEYERLLLGGIRAPNTFQIGICDGQNPVLLAGNVFVVDISQFLFAIALRIPSSVRSVEGIGTMAIPCDVPTCGQPSITVNTFVFTSAEALYGWQIEWGR